jgi:hypothetical protein
MIFSLAVILSGAAISRSEVVAKSKDPFTLHRTKSSSRRLYHRGRSLQPRVVRTLLSVAFDVDVAVDFDFDREGHGFRSLP